MPIPAIIIEPAALYAGDTINWRIALPDYPATGGWTLKYKAVSAAGYFALVSAAAGADHAVTAAKAVTATYQAGSYTLTKYVESAGERVILAELPLTVLPDLAAKTAPFDNRSHVKKVLDAIEAVLEGRATVDQMEMSIDGTTIKRMPVADLLKLRSTYAGFYRQELSAANIAAGLGSGNKILVRFR